MFYIIIYGESRPVSFGPFDTKDEAVLFLNMMKTLDSEYRSYIVTKEVEKGIME